MIGIELFSGAGGMATGAEQAGVRIYIAVEKDAYAAQTYMRNHRGTTVVIDNIEHINEYAIVFENLFILISKSKNINKSLQLIAKDYNFYCESVLSEEIKKNLKGKL